MKNQQTRELLENSIKMDELYHHGTLGMHWGERHGPPYPLSGGNLLRALSDSHARMKEKRKQKREKYAELTKQQHEAALARKQKAIDKTKKKLLDDGDMDAIYKNRKLFTNEELNYAQERHQALTATKNAKNAVQLTKVMNVVTQAGKIATAAVPIITVTKGIYEINQMDKKAVVDDLKRRDSNTNLRIAMISAFNPDAGMKELNRVYKTNYQYDASAWKEGSQLIKILLTQTGKGDGGGKNK